MCCHVGGNIDFDGDGQPATCPRATTRTRSPRTATRRSTTRPNRNPVVRRAPQRRQHERPARQDPAHQARRTAAGYTIPQGNLFRAGPRQDQARDLRDGPAQPVPVRASTATTATSTSATTRRTPTRADPLRGPAGHGRWISSRSRPTMAGRTASRRRCRTSTTTSRPRPRAESSTARRRRNDSPHNTGLTTLPAVDAPGRLVLVRAVAALPGARARGPGGQRRHRADGRPGLRAGPGNRSVFRFPNYYEGKPLFYEWSRDYIKEFRLNEQRRLSEIRPFPVVRRQPDGHGVRARTARSTCSSTATATSPRTRTRSCRRSTSSAATARRSSKVAANADGRPRAARRSQFSSAGTERPRRRRARLRVGLRRRRHGRLARRQPDATPTRATARTAPTLKVTDRTERIGVGRGARAGRQPAEPVRRADTTPTPDERRSSSARPSPTRSRSPTTRRSTARRSPWPTCSATSSTATRSPRPRAAPGSITTPLDTGHAGAANLSAVFGASYTDPGEDGQPGLTGTDEVRLVPSAGPTPTPAARPTPRPVAAQRSSWVAAAAGPGFARAHAASSAARARSAGRASARRTASRTPHGVQNRGASRTPTPAQSTRAAFSAMSPARRADQHRAAGGQRPRERPVAAVGDHEVAARHRLARRTSTARAPRSRARRVARSIAITRTGSSASPSRHAPQQRAATGPATSTVATSTTGPSPGRRLDERPARLPQQRPDDPRPRRPRARVLELRERRRPSSATRESPVCVHGSGAEPEPRAAVVVLAPPLLEPDRRPRGRSGATARAPTRVRGSRAPIENGGKPGRQVGMHVRDDASPPARPRARRPAPARA